jgi:hypothetical protein
VFPDDVVDCCIGFAGARPLPEVVRMNRGEAGGVARLRVRDGPGGEVLRDRPGQGLGAAEGADRLLAAEAGETRGLVERGEPVRALGEAPAAISATGGRPKRMWIAASRRASTAL